MLVALVCFLLSWLTPNTFSPLFKNKLLKGWIRFVLGASVIIFFVLFGIASDSDNNSKTKREEPAVAQEKAEGANLSENKQKASQEDIKKEEISEVEEKDFSVYNEFLNLREVQLKKLDKIISNKAIFSKDNVSSIQQLAKILDPIETPEYLELQQLQDNFYEFEKKLDKNNPLHKVILESLDFYTAGSIKSYQNLLLYSNTEEMKFAEEERKRGDNKVEELLILLKRQGYKNNISLINNSKKQETPVSQAKSYKQVFSFSGEGAKNSETFAITGSKFRIKYDCVKTTMTPLCQAVLRSPKDESLYKEIFNTTGETQSETIFYEKGTFYIEATVMGGEFDIIVEEYK